MNAATLSPQRETPAQPPSDSPSAAEIQAVLGRIFSSGEFQNAAVQRAFLSYVVEQSLHGHGDQIKEYTVGIDVFHRGDSFDPRRDNIVREKARRLRKSLVRYYENEGRHDFVRIEFPIGSYRPIFRYAAAPAKVERPQPVIDVAAPPETHVSWVVAQSLLPVVLVILAVFGLMGLGIYLFKSRTPVRAAFSPLPSIAVLPFRILGTEAQDEFIGDGLTEDLTDALAQMPGMRVVAASSAFQYKGKITDVREVGRELNVGAVLEGSVRRSQNHVRITTELTDTGTGFHLWSASYDRDMKDVLAIQREISGAIAGALGVTLLGSKPPGADASAATSSEGYEDYLKGRYFLSHATLHDSETASGYFRQAIVKDPSYAPAYAGLAQCYSTIPVYANAVSADTVRQIRETASRALALDGMLGEAHVELARADDFDYQWAEANQEFAKALELSPGAAVVHRVYGAHLMRLGRLQEALAEFQTSRILDPVSASTVRDLGWSLYFMRRYDDALKQYQAALELEPNAAGTHEFIGIAYMMKGLRSQGIKELGIAHNLVPDNPWYLGLLGWAEAVDGKQANAREILQSLLDRAAHDPSPARAIAHVYMGLGDKDRAFEWLQKGVDGSNVNMVFLKIEPMYDPIRSDPRFSALLRRMNLN